MLNVSIRRKHMVTNLLLTILGTITNLNFWSVRYWYVLRNSYLVPGTIKVRTEYKYRSSRRAARDSAAAGAVRMCRVFGPVRCVPLFRVSSRNIVARGLVCFVLTHREAGP